jgi:hypothetical protein
MEGLPTGVPFLLRHATGFVSELGQKKEAYRVLNRRDAPPGASLYLNPLITSRLRREFIT